MDGNIINIQADGAVPGFKGDFRDAQPREVFHFPPDICFLIRIIDLHCFLGCRVMGVEIDGNRSSFFGRVGKIVGPKQRWYLDGLAKSHAEERRESKQDGAAEFVPLAGVIAGMVLYIAIETVIRDEGIFPLDGDAQIASVNRVRVGRRRHERLIGLRQRAVNHGEISPGINAIIKTTEGDDGCFLRRRCLD